MIILPHKVEQQSALAAKNPFPFAREWVTLTKQEYIQLVWESGFWKKSHQRALARFEMRESEYKIEIEQASAREAALRAALETALAKVRDLQKRVFGRKSEQSSNANEALSPDKRSHRSRGHQKGKPGHGRTMHPHLPVRDETIEIESPHCPCCGLEFADFPGTEDSEILEIEVKAYRRVIHRRRYQQTCQCPDLPGIITAPAPARLINKGKYGISIWVHLLLSKFLYGQPTHRLLQELFDLRLGLSAGTITGGLKVIAPLFETVEKALLAKLQSEAHWHADETRWLMFVEVEGKIGHRWYLWVFQSKSVIHYVLDPTRSADVPIDELSSSTTGGIVSCDRYSAYKKFARLHTQFILAFCWVHQRRDFLELANAYPKLYVWAFVWVDKIGELYHLNKRRLEVRSDAMKFAECDQILRNAIERMAICRKTELNEASLDDAAIKVLQSMEHHWAGLTVFVDHPDVPMDNNIAEQAMRSPVIGRKNYYGSGSLWSGDLAATMFSLFRTLKLWGINPRIWLSAYLCACAANGNQSPTDLSTFLPWSMDEERLAAMMSAPDNACRKGNDTS